MLKKVQLDKVLFLDIETVPQVYQFQDLDEKPKELFETINLIKKRTKNNKVLYGGSVNPKNIDELNSGTSSIDSAAFSGNIDSVVTSLDAAVQSLVGTKDATGEKITQTTEEAREYGWDYLYEPDPQSVVDELLKRYVEALIYQAVAENMASE